VADIDHHLCLRVFARAGDHYLVRWTFRFGLGLKKFDYF